MNRYEILADKIEEKIRKGIMLSGHKLPSVRDLSAKEDVSPTTVVDAYDLLKSRGLIEARDRSGFFVSFIPLSSLDVSKKSASFIPSHSLNPDDLIKTLRLAIHDEKIFPFGVAAPLPEFYPLKAVSKVIHKTLTEEPDLMSEYRFPPGSIRFRDQVADRYNRFGVKLSVESIVTTAGAIEAIGLSLKAIARPGDVIAVETPCYFGIIQLVTSMGFKILEIPIEPEIGLTAERFKEALKKSGKSLKALVTISNFSNPLGSSVPDETKKEIVSLATKAGVVIIEDDIYGDLYFERKRPCTYKFFDKHDTVIICGSFSKTISPSFRVGYACSKKYAQEIMYQKVATTSGVSALGEECIATLLDTDVYEKHLKFLRSSYKNLLGQYSSAILSSFPSGTKISQPKGGFVLWVQLPKEIDSRVIQRKALEQSISIAPGTIFSPSHKDYVNFMRINAAIPWSTQSQKAITKLSKLLT